MKNLLIWPVFVSMEFTSDTKHEMRRAIHISKELRHYRRDPEGRDVLFGADLETGLCIAIRTSQRREKRERSV